jgi:hypothetical protein
LNCVPFKGKKRETLSELPYQPGWKILPYLRARESWTQRNRMAPGYPFLKWYNAFWREFFQYHKIPDSKARLSFPWIHPGQEGKLSASDSDVCIYFGLFLPCVFFPVPPEWVQFEIQSRKVEALKDAKTKADSSAIEEVFGYTERGTLSTIPIVTDSQKKGWRTGTTFRKNYKSKLEYDSAQRLLPAKERDGWFTRMINLKLIELKSKYAGDYSRLASDLVDHLMHTFPYLLFVTLPLYGLILKLLYVRHKQFYYVDHGIFLTHLYIFTFLLLLIYFLIIKINEKIESGWLNFIEFSLIIYGIYYAFQAMYKFYGQRKGKTFLKFMILNFFAFFCIIFLFTFFFIISVFQI